MVIGLLYITINRLFINLYLLLHVFLAAIRLTLDGLLSRRCTDFAPSIVILFESELELAKRSADDHEDKTE